MSLVVMGADCTNAYANTPSPSQPTGLFPMGFLELRNSQQLCLICFPGLRRCHWGQVFDAQITYMPKNICSSSYRFARTIARVQLRPSRIYQNTSR